MYPDSYSSLSSYTKLTSTYMKKADHNIVNIIGSQYEKKTVSPYLQHENVDAVFFYLFQG